MDFITDLPRSSGSTVIWVVVDRFSKMAHFIPLPGLPSARELADLFLNHVFRLHGAPDDIVSDRGVQFISRFWRSFCSRLGINLSFSSGFHPETNGQTERTNQTLEQYLRCFVSDCQEEWAAYLPFAEVAYNNSEHASTKMSPFRCVGGRDPRLSSLAGPSTDSPVVDQWFKDRRPIWSSAQRNLRSAVAQQKKFADRHRTVEQKFKVGDQVWVSTRNIPLRQPSSKLGPRFIGPYPVTQKINRVTYKVALPPSIRGVNTFHVSLLKSAADSAPFIQTPSPLEVQGVPEFEVNRILDSRFVQRSLQYLVDWKGFGPEERCWIPARQVHADELVAAFHRDNPGKACLESSEPPPRGGG